MACHSLHFFHTRSDPACPVSVQFLPYLPHRNVTHASQMDIVKPMESVSVVRCPGCGYDGNNPFFRFCGICGSALERESRAAPPPAKASKMPALVVSSYSILGLVDEPASSESAVKQAPNKALPAPNAGKSPSLPEASYPLQASPSTAYLLEDDEDEDASAAPRIRLALGLTVLVIGAAALAWQWYLYGSPLAYFAGATRTSAMASPSPRAVIDRAPAQAASPAPSQSAALSANTEEMEKTEAPPPQSVPETQVAPAPQSKTADSLPGRAAVDTPAGTQAPVQQSAVEAATRIAGADVAMAAPAKPTASRTADTSAASVAQPDKVSAADADQLLAEGQKYLYGDGVAQNCGLALQDLRAAAPVNAEAASLLGTMYASGHCVDKNLAPAYRWYARALHKEPSSTRFQKDLTALWNQMTPAEKQAAVRIAP